ncbi:hypothetical protein ACISU4_00740 [Streptomyces wuyuanensis]|uniref:hypothetical protein n=1 Tax=Streptomyces wuyuanensis TaxID=1196353 RepID=UPI00380D366C
MKQRCHRLSARPLVAAVLLAAGGLTAAAADNRAAHADEASDTVQANVNVASAISLTVHTEAFTLSGPPNTTVTELNAISFTVTTNNAGGYTVGGRSTEAALQPQDPENPDVIPISRLEFRPSGETLWVPMTTSHQVTRNVDGPSAPDGDDFSTDFRVHIPNVRSDSYRTTLIYTAATK